MTASAEREVESRLTFTLQLRGQVLDGNQVGEPLRAGATEIRLYERNSVPIPIPNGSGPDGNGFFVNGGTIDIDVSVALTSDIVQATTGEDSAVLAEQSVAFTVTPVNGVHREVVTLTPARTAIRGRVLDTRGDPARVDLGIARNDLSTLYSVVGGRDYLPGSNIGSSGVDHRITTDALGDYYFPLRDTGEYFVDVVADTGADTYLATLFNSDVPAAGETDTVNLTLGLQSGGAGCDDLSGIPATIDVDYETTIQPLWRSCVGCHRGGSSNGGGLDLTVGNSFDAIVNVPSIQVPGRLLVAPNDPDVSYMMEKISCSNPQVGNRMRPDSPLSPDEQALVRDWIAQGARRSIVVEVDAGIPDTGVVPDTGVDSGVPDTGIVPDTGVDSGVPDTGIVPDTGV
ncbi:MAG: hypothetical protein AAGK78_12785, partial [Planctomycetota bacterium]